MQKRYEDRGIIHEEKAQVGETKHMLDCPNAACYFMRPQRLVRQIVDRWNKRGLEGQREGANRVICGTAIVN